MDDENTDHIDIESTEEHAEEYIKKLREKLKICQKEKSEYLDGWQRAKADFINARKDDDRRYADIARQTTASVLKEFLTVADSLDLALQHATGDEIAQIQRQFSEILKKYSVTAIESKDKPFDPAFHEALMQCEVSDETQDHIVVAELQKGYMIGDRVIRPSKVQVGIYKQ